MSESEADAYHWLRNGDETYEATRVAIDKATCLVQFEMYIFQPCPPGDALRDAMVRAAERGVEVRVLLDAFGSITLSEKYWAPLQEAGGSLRWFNPLSLHRFNIRNHRKLTVCDRSVAFIGGFNVGPMWCGDGLTSEYRDLGLRLTGTLAGELADSFDILYRLAHFRHRRFTRLHQSQFRPDKIVRTHGGQLLLSGPGRGRNAIHRAWAQDLANARTVQIIAAYFLPPPRLRRAFSRVARRGGRVQLILPGPTDMRLMQAAMHGLYHRMLRAGVEIFEYQPQILHTKYLRIDNAVYVGSANLDMRSFRINYELLVRIDHPSFLKSANQMFLDHLDHSRRIDLKQWRQSRTIWSKIFERLAHFLFTHIDPLITRRQLRSMR
jgi:cardiolipin synthase A/B